MPTKGTLVRWIVLSGTALSSCSSDEEPSPIVPPPIEDIFLDRNADGVVGDPYPVSFDMDGNPVMFETRYLFDDTRLRELCLWPDADSFDDYEEPDVGIERGTTPVSTECPPDGIVTGPMHAELLPSSWCRIEGCVTVGEPAGTPREY